ncbi:PREDICTED: IgA FC receptor-like [Nicrophorus vespilloides]|uniref:IgA FC receptor-like n=1 Tax=Nicrophorus vespilloides TaxID=110193 RepID=A0ABM1MPC0_NICVS|nr:PREDICTED: IgA FC receptor-like [Nicrophorus vespilloides]
MEKSIRNLINQFEVLSNSLAQEKSTPIRKPIKQLSTQQVFTTSVAASPEPPKAVYVSNVGNKNVSGKLNSINQDIADLLNEINESPDISHEKFIEILQVLVENLISLGCIDVEGNYNLKQKKAACFSRIQECNTELMKTKSYEALTPKKNLQKSKSLSELPEEVEKEHVAVPEVQEEEIHVSFKSVKLMKNLFDSKENINDPPNFSVNKALKRSASFSVNNPSVYVEAKTLIGNKIANLKHVQEIEEQKEEVEENDISVVSESLQKPSNLKTSAKIIELTMQEVNDVDDEEIKESNEDDKHIIQEQPKNIIEKTICNLKKLDEVKTIESHESIKQISLEQPKNIIEETLSKLKKVDEEKIIESHEEIPQEQTKKIIEETLSNLKKVPKHTEETHVAEEDSNIKVDEQRLLKPSSLKAPNEERIKHEESVENVQPKSDEAVTAKNDKLTENIQSNENSSALTSFSLLKNILNTQGQSKNNENEVEIGEQVDVEFVTSEFDELCDENEIDEDTDKLFNDLIKSEDLAPVSRDSECSMDTVISVDTKEATEEIDVDPVLQNAVYSKIPEIAICPAAPEGYENENNDSYVRPPGIQICPRAPEGYISPYDDPNTVPEGDEYSELRKLTEQSIQNEVTENENDDDSNQLRVTQIPKESLSTLTDEDKQEQAILFEIDHLFNDLNQYKDIVDTFDSSKDLSKVEEIEMQLYMLLERLEKIQSINDKTDKLKL